MEFNINFDFLRIAFIFPSLVRGGYWQPILARFSQMFPKTLIIVGIWDGFVPAYKDSFKVKVVGRTKFIHLPVKNRRGHYPIGMALPPIRGLITSLVKFNPHVIFVSGYSLWSLISIFLKPIYRWKIILVYDGSSPSIDRINHKFFLKWRSFLSRFCDAFITNTKAGKNYLVQYLGIPDRKVKVHPYEVPDVTLWKKSACEKRLKNPSKTIFLTVGSLIPRKGIIQLIEATKLLREQVGKRIEVIIVGDGPLRTFLEQKIKNWRLTELVKLLGQVEYHDLGDIICSSDVFVFPSLEDIWGVAPLEAMAMGKPVICSKYAGAHELIQDGVNGFVVDPLDVKSLANLMLRFVKQPQLIKEMGQRAKVKMKQFTPDRAVEFLAEVVLEVYERNI